MNDREELKGLGIVAVLFFLLSYVSVDLAIAPAGIFAVSVAGLKPRWAPFMLILLATIQDSTGLEKDWAYGSFAVVACILILSFMSQQLFATGRTATGKERIPYFLTTLAIAVVIYGFLLSLIHILFEGLSQSADRPFWMISGLMVVMILSAHLSVITIRRYSWGVSGLILVVSMAISNSFIVAVLQILIGPHFGHSASYAEDMLLQTQLSEASGLGFSRVTSVFVSPNAFPLILALLLLVVLVSRFRLILSLRFLAVYVLIGSLAGVMSLSKSMIIFFIVTSLVLLLISKKRLPLLSVVVILAIIFVIYAYEHLVTDAVQDAFRFKFSDDTYRVRAWNIVLSELSWDNWLIGTGISHWQELFGNSMGVRLLDPHSVLFSIPGTFGFFGILFYVLLCSKLIGIVFSKKINKNIQFGAFSMLVFFLGKDLVSIPYIFGNTPMSFLVWLILGLIFSDMSAQRNVADGDIQLTTNPDVDQNFPHSSPIGD